MSDRDAEYKTACAEFETAQRESKAASDRHSTAAKMAEEARQAALAASAQLGRTATFLQKLNAEQAR